MNQQVGLGFFVLLAVFCSVDSQCSRRCDLALGSYNIWEKANLTFISEVFETTLKDILSYNPQVTNPDFIMDNTRIRVPYSSCDCIGGQFLGKVFKYKLRSGDTYDIVATTYYANLTTSEDLQSSNSYPATNLQPDEYLNVTLNCSCGNSSISEDYGLFLSYPLLPGDNLTSLAASANLNATLLQSYNPGKNFSAGSGLVFIPTNGNFLCSIRKLVDAW